MNPADDFDGSREIYHAENGASYGLTEDTYWSLASCCMGAKKFGGVEPCEIAPLPDRPGCVVTLFGKTHYFELRVDAGCTPNLVTLLAAFLDQTKGEPVQLCAPAPDEPRTWSRVIYAMLQADGLTTAWRWVSFEEANAELRRQGII